MDDVQYLIDGREVYVIEKLSSGYLIDQYYEDHDGEYMLAGSPYVVKQVFDKPPTEKFEKEISALMDKRERLVGEISALRKEFIVTEKEGKERIEKLKKYDGLEFLEEFLDGKITHYVRLHGYQCPSIISIDETKSRDEDGDLRLLSIFGRKDRKVSWNLHKYADGSGGTRSVVPCGSLEYAESKCREAIVDQFVETKENPSLWLIERANKLGVEVPREYLSLYKEQASKATENRIATLEKDAEDAAIQLATIQDMG